jgi:L-ascorbate metabolism protein UlaG (beta-lactamase superfamily)
VSKITSRQPITGGRVLRIRWHGHACFEVGGSVTVVTDPHDGKSIGIAPPRVKADVVLVSHNHFDHNCVRLVSKQESAVITKPVMTVEHGVRIEGIESFHDEQGGAKRGNNTIFRFELDGTTFCHLGDLGHAVGDDIADRIGSVDVLFVPVGDVFTIGPETARGVIERIGPRVAIPMHYRTAGLSLSVKPLENFLALCPKEQIVKVGNEVDFADDDMPSKGTEFWIFTP